MIPKNLTSAVVRLTMIAAGFLADSAASGADCCPSDYWIVSSRRCPQDAIPCGGCAFDYFHMAPDGCLRLSRQPSFRQWLQPGIPVCVMVHGSFVNWDEVRHESHRTYQWLRKAAPHRALQVVFYTWPSDGAVTLLPHLDIGVLGRRSGLNGFYLVQLISEIPADQPICLLGHSHGARMVASTLHLMGGGEVEGYRLATPPNGRRMRAVLAAAAIDHHWLNPGERYGRALIPTECLLNLRNRNDLPLAAYPLRKPFSSRALARAGFTEYDQWSLGRQGGKVAELHVSALIGTGHMWPNYYRRPEIAAAIASFVYFDDAPPAAISGSAGGDATRRAAAVAEEAGDPLPTSGNFSVNVVPLPSALSTRIRP